MYRIFQPFLLMLAQASEHELARMIEYLKTENRILREKLPKRINVTLPERRRLVTLGQPLGSKLKELITIVSPRTFARWASGEGVTKGKGSPRGTGRPRTESEIEDLVVQIAKETGWGYTRILGELKKFGIRSIARSTVVNILKRHGLDPGPQRGEGSWDAFVKRHAATLWACDFFTKKIWTKSGLVDMFVLFFIHVGSRRVHISGMTTHPDGVWMVQQARNLTMFFDEQADRPQFLLRDHDTKFVKEFDGILESEGIEVKALGPRAPNLNAFAERWVQSVKQECLDHFVVFGESHL